jgi:hypothetical protein
MYSRILSFDICLAVKVSAIETFHIRPGVYIVLCSCLIYTGWITQTGLNYPSLYFGSSRIMLAVTAGLELT